MADLPEICYRVADYLAEKYDPQAVIAYGSYVTGSWRPDSDMDLILITADPEPPPLFPELRQLTLSGLNMSTRTSHEYFEGVELSITIYSVDCLDWGYFLEPSHRHRFAGRVLYQKNGVGDLYLSRAKYVLQKTIPYSEKSKQTARAQLLESLQAVKTGSDLHRKFFLVESFQQLAVLCDALPVGGKVLLRYLRRDASEAYETAAKALRPDAPPEDIYAWGEYILSHEIKINFMDMDFSCLREEPRPCG